jgi:hypothetical protein
MKNFGIRNRRNEVPKGEVKMTALQTLRDNGHGLEVVKLLACGVPRRIHLFPKGAALFEIMGRDAVRRLFDLI